MRMPAENELARVDPRAFTLVELMVAMTVSSILLLALLQALGAVTGVSSRTAGRIEAEREARATFEILARDLESAVRSSDLSWIQAGVDPAPPVAGGNPHWLTFLAVPRDHDSSQPGDLCALSYRLGLLRPDPDPSSPAIPALCRLRIDPDEAFGSALTGGELRDGFFTDRETANPESRDQRHWFSSGVLDFQVRFLDANGSLDPGTHSEAEVRSRARFLEITLEVLTPQGRHLLGVVGIESLRQRHAHRFTRRIILPNPPL